MLAGPYTPSHASSYLLRDAMERRGRSRAIPTTAAIRKSRRHQRQLYYPHYPTNSPSPSLSPIRSPGSDDSTSPQSTTLEPLTPPELLLDYYESPPTPPQSLEDQIHEAYALDNFHLAKILYLKLQGIHVVDDSDPRIEEVREEDFPFGRLILDEDDERTLKECQRAELHRKRDQRRANKLAQCERAWDQSIVEYRQQCLSVQRRKQATALASARRPDTADCGRHEQHRSLVHASGPSAYSLLSHKSPNDTTSCLSTEYSVPINPSSPLDIPGRSTKSYNLRREPPQVASLSQSLPFRQVHACMNDALFPNDDSPSDLRSRKRQSHVHATLLEVLLQPVTWEKGERSEARVKRRDSLSAFSTWSSNGTLCSACSPASGSPSTVGSSHSGHQFATARRLTISTSTTCASSARMRAARCGAHSLTPVDLHQSPLSFPVRPYPQPDVPSFVQHPKSRSHFAKRLAQKIGTSVSTLMDVAAQFQASYMRTAGSVIQFEAGSPYDEAVAYSWSAKSFMGTAKAKTWLRFDPTRPRVKTSEAMAFVEGSPWSEAMEETGPELEHYTLVQLLSPSERTLPPPSSSMYITPSPLRPRDAPASLRCRLRPVANPVLLRLKALQNVCAGEGVEWEGRAREGALGFGRDRLQGIAFDGIGRSRLSWEVSF